jgi:putative addiction module component (TIGR02574 family)
MNINSLTPKEKVVLAQQLWDSVISDEKSLDVSAEQKAELDRRVIQFEKNPDTSSSWDEVKSRILNK